jgi:hypothetical protein
LYDSSGSGGRLTPSGERKQFTYPRGGAIVHSPSGNALSLLVADVECISPGLAVSSNDRDGVDGSSTKPNSNSNSKFVASQLTTGAADAMDDAVDSTTNKPLTEAGVQEEFLYDSQPTAGLFTSYGQQQRRKSNSATSAATAAAFSSSSSPALSSSDEKKIAPPAASCTYTPNKVREEELIVPVLQDQSLQDSVQSSESPLPLQLSSNRLGTSNNPLEMETSLDIYSNDAEQHSLFN